MIGGLGSDICNIRRIEQTLQKFGRRFIERIFSPAEQKEMEETCRYFAASAAKRFAAKEAFSKALGTGFAQGMKWSEVEILHQESGQPFIRLSGRCRYLAEQLAPQNKIWVSLSDDYPYAQAVVIIEKL